jgi:hypothetical protein
MVLETLQASTARVCQPPLSGNVWTEVPSPVLAYPDANTAQWVDDGTFTSGLKRGLVFYRVKLEL